MKWYVLSLLFCVSGLLLGADVPCNERARHGRSGAVKSFIAVAGCVALYHMAGELWDTATPLRTGVPLHATWRDRDDSLREIFSVGCALAALGYVTYKLSYDAISSLRIFLDDDEEPSENENEEQVPLPVQ